MKRSAPFLKMYTEYVSGYSNAMNLINTYQQKCPRFASIMYRIHVSLTFVCLRVVGVL